jgi:uncharacterized membrane protein YraQ (UPF0718 family)
MSDSFTPTGIRPTGRTAAGLVAFALLAVIGLEYVKWAPFFRKLLMAAAGGRARYSILSEDVLGPPWRAAWQYAWAYGRDIWKALLLGLLLGARVQALVPAEWIERLFGRPGHRSVAAAGLVSIPSMMCTCCAAPIAVGLKQAGASPRAALAYWLGNPLLNPATLVLIAFVIGWRWMMLRLMLGLVLVLGPPYLVDEASDFAGLSTSEALGGARFPLAEGTKLGSSLWVRWCREFWRLSIALIPEYIFFVFLLGAAKAWFFDLRGLGPIDGLWWTAALACAGTLFVIPTGAEIPIVQTMIAARFGTGPAAALLITLPAVSIPSLAMMAKALPLKALLSITLFIAGAGVLAGAIVWMLQL